jgi:single-strand DNA-binding protein
MLTITAYGNLAADPEQRTTDSGTTITSFRMGVNTGRDETTWVNCAVFGKRGDTVLQFFRKGSKVCVSGSAKLREYTTKDGRTGQSLDMIVNDFTLPARQAEPAAGADDMPF